MLRSYLLTTYRALKSRPLVTAINVAGLAVGLAACAMIGLWVQQQLRYDRFHPEAQNVYRVALKADSDQGTMRAPVSPPPLANALRRDYPTVARATQIDDVPQATIDVGGQAFTDEEVLEADSSFFGVFSGFGMHAGDPESALVAPDAAVVTRSAARRFFGTTNAVGRTLEAGDETYRVTAVTDDVPPASHLQFDVILAMDAPEGPGLWLQNSTRTYARLRSESDPAAFESEITAISERYVGPQALEQLGMTADEFQEQSGITYFAQPLTSIHLHSDMQYELRPTGSIAYVWMFSAVALFILLLACINFTNLATARATERAGEIGMRKALGAHRGQLAGQFLGEAVLTTAVSGAAALFLLVVSLPAFNRLAGTQLTMEPLLGGYGAAAAVGVLVVGLLAGVYPALVLSRYSPVSVLKSGRSSSGGRGSILREGLVVVQFAVTIAMIAGTGVVWSQFDYIQNKRLGLDRERVLVVERTAQLADRQAAMKDQLRKQPGVVAVGASDAMFAAGGEGINNFSFVPNNRPVTEGRSASTVDVDEAFVDAMDIDIVAGRSFDATRATDTSAVVINRAAMKTFGFDKAPTDNTLRTLGEQGQTYDVIGVVDDFHLQSLRQPVRPMVLMLDRSPGQVLVRLEAGHVNDAIASVRDVWTSFRADTPISYSLADARFTDLHGDTQRTGRLFMVFAALAVAVACFGLFGLATYAAQRRTKEIGIRKALGATSGQIILLLSNRFIRLVVIAFVLAAPLAWYGMNQWLQGFAYRAEVGPDVYLFAGGLAFLVALATVSTQAFRAARLDPATTLRDE